MEREAARFTCRSAGSSIAFASVARDTPHSGYAGVGFYHKAEETGSLAVTVRLGEEDHSYRIETTRTWAKWGSAFADRGGRVEIRIEPSASIKVLHLWGVSGGQLVLPAKVQAAVVKDAGGLSKNHLAPESLYLDHDARWAMSPERRKWRNARLENNGATLMVKKCAYCQRYLPLDPERPSALAFHKHNAKKTKHQNECRACKKFRINDDLNGKRTPDQLHESSTITRERKLLLKENQILKQIKQREGAGLKSIIWKRFEKRCFKCGRSVKLSEVELDHTRPLAYLWPIDTHATCLCGTCNNNKGDRFPADFYNAEELRRLAVATGLSVQQLRARKVNLREVKRIRANIAKFASAWDARTLNAIARKISEIHPEIQLWEDLRKAAPEQHKRLLRSLAKAPK